jgi:hypothetical protein
MKKADFSDLEYLLILQADADCRELMYELQCISQDINSNKPFSPESKSNLANLLIKAINSSQLSSRIERVEAVELLLTSTLPSDYCDTNLILGVILDFIKAGKLTKPADFVVAMNPQELNVLIHGSLPNTDSQNETESHKNKEVASDISSLVQEILYVEESNPSPSGDDKTVDSLRHELAGRISSVFGKVTEDKTHPDVVGNIEQLINQQTDAGKVNDRESNEPAGEIEDISRKIGEILGL